MRFGPNLSHSVNGAGLDPTLPDAHHSVMPRADDFSQHALQAHQALPPDLGGHSLSNMSMSQYQSMYDSGIENQVPDHLLDDNDGSETGGTKKKKGSSSSLANDELDPFFFFVPPVSEPSLSSSRWSGTWFSIPLSYID